MDMHTILETADVKKLRRTLRDAVKGRGWTAVIGEAGSGKTTTVNQVLEEEDGWLPIQPACLDSSRVTISYVLSAVVNGIAAAGIESGETPRLSLSAREIQAARMLGVASQSREVVIVLEEAHKLHWRTLTCLKRMREMRFKGLRSPLFTLVLVGQPELRHVLAVRREVFFRCRRTDVRGLSPSEFGEFAKAMGWTKMAQPGALDQLDNMTWDELHGRSYIEAMAKFDDALALAGRRGHRKVEVGDVDDVFTTLKARVKRCSLSLQQIANRAGLAGRSSVLYELDKGAGKGFEGVRRVVEEEERKKVG